LERLWNYHFAILAHHVHVINESDFQSFVEYCIAPEAMLEFDIGFLGLCNLWSDERNNLLFLAMVCKNFI
jgi:hypothetical protein